MSTSVQDDRVSEEAWLIAKIGGGDREGLSELYRRYSGPLYSLALRMVGDARDAEELLQDTFVKIWTGARTYDANLARPFTWAMTIARRTGIDALRRRGRPTRTTIDVAAAPSADTGAVNPLDATTRSDDAARVRAAMAAFPPDQRAVIELAVFDGIPHAEIAKRLNQPLGTVKSWIRRGLADLKNVTRGD